MRRARRHEGAGWPERPAREIDEELRFHLEGRVEALVAAGHSEDEAWSRALAAFGDVERIRGDMLRIEAERIRRRRWRERVAGFAMDCRIAGRRLLRAPGHTTAAVLTLGLGIGATVAMFAVVDAVALRPLPYQGADRLVQIWPRRNFNITLSRLVAEGSPSVQAFTGLSRWGLTLTGEGEAAVLSAQVVDAGYFETFGVRPALGRPFTREETDPSQSAVVLLSHGLWRSRFGADPDVVGRRLRLDGYAHEVREVIGVMPADHRALGDPADVWVPLHVARDRAFAADSTWYVNQLIARLRPGATVEGVSTEVRAVLERVRESSPGHLDEAAVRSAGAVALMDGLVGSVRKALWLLLGAVGLVLLIACANIANLQLARAAGRRRDLALRAALGASRGRLMGEQLVESALLALSGGVLGVLLAHWALAALRVAEVSGLPRVADVGIDARAAGFALFVATLSVLLAGVIPAIRVAATAPREDLQEGARNVSAGRSAHRVSRSLVALEVALSVVLVTSAGHLLASFATLRSVEPGLDVTDVLAVKVAPSSRRHEGDRAVQLYADVLQRVRALRGVTAAGAIQLEPFTEGNWAFPYLAEGHAPPSNAPLPSANFRVVTEDYFAAVDLPVLTGRPIETTDRSGGPNVMVINRRMAEELWPAQDPLGREIRVFGSMPFRVVGVVGDVHQHALDREPQSEMYVPLAQWHLAHMVLMIETPDPAALIPAVRQVMRDVDPDIPLASVRPLSDLLAESMARRRFYVMLLGCFGGLALLLAGVGVYGVTSHMVGTRLPDYGVRLALGASPASVLRHALVSALSPAAVGLGLGIAGAVAAARLLSGLLFGIPAIHPPTYIAVAATLATVALLATWLPARRAARMDPLVILRSG